MNSIDLYREFSSSPIILPDEEIDALTSLKYQIFGIFRADYRCERSITEREVSLVQVYVNEGGDGNAPFGDNFIGASSLLVEGLKHLDKLRGKETDQQKDSEMNLKKIINLLINATNSSINRRMGRIGCRSSLRAISDASALDVAICNKQEDIAIQLVEKGACVNLSNYSSDYRSDESDFYRNPSPLENACENMLKNLANLLIKKGADVFCERALERACQYHWHDTIILMHEVAKREFGKKLQRLGFEKLPFDINVLIGDYTWSTDFFSSSGLWASFRWPEKFNQQTVDLLIERGGIALFNQKSADYIEIPLYYVALNFSTEYLRKILARGADGTPVDIEKLRKEFKEKRKRNIDIEVIEMLSKSTASKK